MKNEYFTDSWPSLHLDSWYDRAWAITTPNLGVQHPKKSILIYIVCIDRSQGGPRGMQGSHHPGNEQLVNSCWVKTGQGTIAISMRVPCGRRAQGWGKERLVDIYNDATTGACGVVATL